MTWQSSQSEIRFSTRHESLGRQGILLLGQNRGEGMQADGAICGFLHFGFFLWHTR
jgi:hypothetical protein